MSKENLEEQQFEEFDVLSERKKKNMQIQQLHS
jgi:hypothetical protein